MWCNLAPDQHDCFDLLCFSTWADLPLLRQPVGPPSGEVTLVMPNLVWTPDMYSAPGPRTPGCKGSSCCRLAGSWDSQVAEIFKNRNINCQSLVFLTIFLLNWKLFQGWEMLALGRQDYISVFFPFMPSHS